jgi:alanine racemase
LNDLSLEPGPGRGAIAPAEAGGRLTIDLDALAANWRRLRDRAAPAECGAVVKADAYGIGIGAAVPALARAGCRTFFVAHLAEAIRVREVAERVEIYVLNGLLPGTGPAYAGFRLRPVLGSWPELDEWAGFCRAEGVRFPTALHVDTGMQRLGLPVAEALALRGDPRLGDLVPALLMSHFTSAEVPEDPANARQIAAFEAVRAALPGMPASLANSSGLFLPGLRPYDLARPGYALYGGNPTPGRPNPMRPVVRLEAPVVQVRTVEDGEPVGYNGGWTARGRRRLATVSVGYADGYPRAAGSTDAKRDGGIPAGEAVVAGRRCPFAGRVSMDLIIIDVTDIPGVERGTPVTLIGDDLSVDEVSRRAGTIGYEVLTGLGPRYARSYLGTGVDT